MTDEQETPQTGEGLLAGYGGEELPLSGYAGLVGIYAAGFAALLVAAKGNRRPLPDKIGLSAILFT